MHIQAELNTTCGHVAGLQDEIWLLCCTSADLMLMWT